MSGLFILKGHVHHSRSEITSNSFRYPIMNIYFPLSEISSLKKLFKSRFHGLLGFNENKHLTNRENLRAELKQLVKSRFNYENENVFLQTIPEMFGYVFNPV